MVTAGFKTSELTMRLNIITTVALGLPVQWMILRYNQMPGIVPTIVVTAEINA